MQWVWLATALLYANHLTGSEESVAKRVYDHLSIRDTIAAVEEAERAVAQFPHSRSIQVAYVRALIERGEEVRAWQQWTRLDPVKKKLSEWDPGDIALLESMAWGALYQGSDSNQLTIRLHALLGAAMTRDARAIPLLTRHLRGSNAILRAFAVQLSASYGDEVLQQEIIRLFQEEKVWYVRQAVIQAVGQLRIETLKEALTEIILEKKGAGLKSPKALAEEKSAAMISLLQMSKKVEGEEWRSLMMSSRAGLRELACEMVIRSLARMPLDSSSGLRIPLDVQMDPVAMLDKTALLLQDHSPDVRMAALNALTAARMASLGPRRVADLIRLNLTDTSPAVAITAARCLLLLQPEQGAAYLEKWLEHPDVALARLASAAIAVSGQYGVSLARKHLQTADPYVRANLAWGLLGQRIDVERACKVLDDVLTSEKETLWMWDSSVNPQIRSLAPSRVHHIEQVPHYPVVVDQMTRLEILSALSRLRYKNAIDAMRQFLATRTWGVTGSAAAVLLQEGDQADWEVVQGLLTDPDEKIRVQAALILAIVGSDVSSIPILQEAYPHMDREMKVHILEALAHVGHADSIPFLIDVLKEPFQSLRVVAASAILIALEH